MCELLHACLLWVVPDNWTCVVARNVKGFLSFENTKSSFDQ